MRTTVTARHCEISDDLKTRAEKEMERMSKIVARPLGADVIFDADHGRRVVELKLTLPRGQIKIASGEADNFRTALDRAADKLRNQLDKNSRRATRRSSVPE